MSLAEHNRQFGVARPAKIKKAGVTPAFSLSK
jgi:hypothetical protein